MLTPNQVIPFLTHDDPIVRSAAEDYFHQPSDFGDLTADYAWAVIDRLGENERTLKMASWLQELPQTDESVRRLIAALQSDAPEAFDYHYQLLAESLDLGALIGHGEKLLAVPTLLPHVRANIELQLAMLEQPAEAMWDRLMAHGLALADNNDGLLGDREADAAIEAAARAGPAVCDRAIAILADRTLEDWRPVLAARVLGEARYAPAIDTLIEAYTIDGDALLEEITPALVRIGTPEVVRKIEAFYPGKLWFSRLSATAPLGKIKLPESEAALLRWVETDLALTAAEDAGTAVTPDPESEPLVLSLLHELTALGSLAGFDRSRELIAAGPLDGELIGLCEGLLGVAAMHGVTLPEERRWRRWVQRRQERRAPFLRAMNGGASKAQRDHWRATGEEGYASDRFGDPPKGPERSALELMSDRSVPKPIRNAEPKVGRNDPCPCGSAKKYKKCCLGK